MASKLYLHAATTTVAGTLPAAGVSVSATTPTKIASGVNRTLSRAIGVAQTSQASTTNNVTTAQPSLMARWVSPPVSAQTFASQAIGFHIGGSESGTNSNFQIRSVVALWRPSTNTKIGLLTDLATTASLEPGTTQTALNGTTASSTSQTAVDGDVLIVELWRDSTVQAAATAFTNTIFYDGTTEDSTTTNAAYINFANTIKFLGDGYGQAQAQITGSPALGQAQAFVYGTKLYLTDDTSDVIVAGEVSKSISFTQGSAAVSKITNAVVGPTTGVQVTDGAGGTPITWYSDPLRGGQSIGAGTTLLSHVWALESVNTANVGLQFRLFQVDQFGNYIKDVQNSEFGTELGTTSALQAWTFGPNFIVHGINHGDRLAVQVLGNDAGGTMAAGTFTITYGAAIGVSGDSYGAVAEVLLKGSNGFGQAQAQISPPGGTGFGQAQATIISIARLIQTKTALFTATTSGTITLDNAPTAGHALIVYSTFGAGLANIVFASGQGGVTTWNALSWNNGPNGYSISFGNIDGTSSAALSFTCSQNDTFRLFAEEWSGVAGLLETLGTATAGTSSAPADSITTVRKSIIITGFGTNSGTAASLNVDGVIDDGPRISVSPTIAAAHRFEQAAGSHVTTYATSGSVAWATWAFSLKVTGAELTAFSQAQATIRPQPPISGFVSWFDAADTSAITSASNLVSQWADKGSGSHNLINNGSGKPSTNLNTVHNLNVLTFDGVQTVLLGTPSITGIPYTVLILAVNTDTGSAQRDVFNHDVSGSGDGRIYRDTSDNIDSYSGTTLSSSQRWGQVPHVVSAVFNGASSKIAVDGGTATTGDSGVLTPNVSSWSVGNSNNIESWKGYIGEIIVYNSALSDADRQSVEVYLINKWFAKNGFAQAQAKIKGLGNGFGQAQADIKAFGVSGLAQAQADIKVTSFGFAQAQADIKATSYGFGQAKADIKAIGRGFAQAQADIKAVGNGLGQAQSDIKAVGNGLAQAQADIKATSSGLGQAQADIKATSYGLAQANADIKSTSYGLAQANADIKVTSTGFGQTQADIKATSNAFAQAQADIRASGFGFGQAQADIKAISYVEAQAQADIKSTSYASAQAQATVQGASSKFAQAQATILATSFAFGQSNADINATSFGEGQAQGKINAFGVNTFGQAQADVKGAEYPTGQAQAKINAFGVNASGQAQADIKSISYGEGQSQADIKSTSYGLGQSNADILVRTFVEAQAQADIKATGYGEGQAQADIKVTSFVEAQAQANIVAVRYGESQAAADILATSNKEAQAQADIKSTGFAEAQAQADIKVTSFASAQAQANISHTSFVEAQAQSSIKAVSSSLGQANADIFATSYHNGQAQADIKSTTQQYGQAQVYIKARIASSGQAQADINVVTSRTGQAQADVKQTYNGAANAQTDIRATINNYGQSNASIISATNVLAQAQAYILNGIDACGQAQAQILASSLGFGQAQAFILKSAGYGQARARVIIAHTLKTVIGSDRASLLLSGSDRAIVVASPADKAMKILGADKPSLVVEASDRSVISILGKDEAY